MPYFPSWKLNSQNIIGILFLIFFWLSMFKGEDEAVHEVEISLFESRGQSMLSNNFSRRKEVVLCKSQPNNILVFVKNNSFCIISDTFFYFFLIIKQNTITIYQCINLYFNMACSKYEYVKKFQETRTSLPETYIMVRIDGRGFTKFCSLHSFQKPNDLRAIRLMNQSAKYVCESFTQIFLAYGQSDEYSFVFNKNTTFFSRRIDKILSCVVSAFTSAYAFNWKKHFEIELKDIPTFDSRIVTYPNDECIKDYFRWRQVDCHINNLYNTTFWCMVKKGMGNQQVEKILKDTNSAKKNQILFSQFQINYNSIEQVYRRGTFLLYVNEKIVTQDKQTDIAQEIQKIDLDKEEQQQQNSKKQKNKKINKQCDKIRRKLVESHQDCIKQQFWKNLLK